MEGSMPPVLDTAELDTTVLIAHQLPEAFQPLLAGLSGGVAFQALPPATAWEVPANAEILFAVPPRGGNVVVPVQKPPGWPGRLRWLHTVSTGVDEFPPWVFDVPNVTCGRGSNSVAIAEFTLAALLAQEKHLPDIWVNSAETWLPKASLGTLKGKTLGLLGFGSIGQEIAARALPFGMEILAFNRSGGTPPASVQFAGLDKVLAQADHLVIALPLTAATSGLIGPAALARVKPGVHLVNIARGRILDHDALLTALASDQVGNATLDVTEPEPLPPGHALYTHPNVRLSPHISWSGSNRAAQSELLRENLRRYLAGEALLNIVPPGRGY
jgi:phosphoglycerate dehydrogenase-like enzyme